MLRTLPAILFSCFLFASCTKKTSTQPASENGPLICVYPPDQAVVDSVKDEISGKRIYRVTVTRENISGTDTTTVNSTIEQVAVDFYKDGNSGALYSTTGNTEVRMLTSPLTVSVSYPQNIINLGGKDVSGTFHEGNYRSTKLDMQFDRSNKTTSNFIVTCFEHNADNERAIKYVFVTI